MSNKEAKRVIADFEAAGKLTVLEDIGARVDAITAMRRRLLVDSGLETKATVDAWEKTYRHYVPLHRDDVGEGMPSRGKGFSIRGRDKRRAGSTRQVTNILPHIVAQYEATLIRAEKAKVGRALLNFVQNHPNPKLWEVDPVEYKPRFDADGLVTYAPDPSYKLADNVLTVRVDGADYHIRFSEKNTHARRIVFAMKNLGAQESGILINQLGKINRWLAMVNTSLNPEFTVTNFMRDVQTAVYNLTATEADKMKLAILKDIGKAWRGINSAVLGKGNHPWAKYYREFRHAGAKTGWLQAYEDINDRRADLERQLKLMQPGAVRATARGLRAIVDFIEAENTAIENAVRLSAFVHARKAGISEAKAARLAKELTVNFNRKGEYGPWLNSLYLFYNASIQGTATILKTIAKSPKARLLVGATVAFATALDLMNRVIGGDDEDGEPYYDKIPDHIKDRNLIIMLPDSGGKYLKVALPWGYNTLHVIGQSLGEAATQRDFDAGKAALRVVSAAADAFSPVQGGDFVQFLSPTALDPFVQSAMNKSWTGEPLYPDEKYEEYPTPDSHKFWPSVREPSKWFAQKLNEITGGSDIEKGAVDISPEVIDLFIDTVVGGMGRFLADSISTPIKAIQGEEVESRTVPFLRRVYGEPESNRTRLEYFERRQSLRQLEDLVTKYGDNPEKLAELEAKHGPELRLLEDGYLDLAEGQIRSLRAWRKAVMAEPESADKKDQLKEIDGLINDVQVEFNRAYNAAKQER